MESDLDTISEHTSDRGESLRSSQVSDADVEAMEVAAEGMAEAGAVEADLDEACSPDDNDKAADLFYLLEGQNWGTLKPDYKLIFYDNDTHLWIVGC
jgi:hypothetical protein